MTMWTTGLLLLALASAQDITTKILNGEETPLLLPWIAFVGRRCGGTLIHPSWIMSAAHCDIVEGDTVEINFRQIANEANSAKIIRRILSVTKHPAYPRTVTGIDDLLFDERNDIALYFLDDAVPVQPIKLPSTQEDQLHLAVGTKVRIAGWGFLYSVPEGASLAERNEGKPNALQWAEVVVRDSTACVAQMNGAYALPIDKNSSFCAGESPNAPDTCKGDSGGPVFRFDAANNRWIVLGITSWGIVCGTGKSGQPALYTRVLPYIPWIQATIAGQSYQLPPGMMNQQTTCIGICGQKKVASRAPNNQCSCELDCAKTGNCCSDVVDTCGYPGSTPGPEPAESCSSCKDQGFAFVCAGQQSFFNDCYAMCAGFTQWRKGSCKVGLPAWIPNVCVGGCGLLLSPYTVPPGFCSCNQACEAAGDCCGDYDFTCKNAEGPLISAPTSAPPSPAGPTTCRGFCGSIVAAPSGCFCDVTCRGLNDCCDDFETLCQATTKPPATTNPPVATTKPPVSTTKPPATNPPATQPPATTSPQVVGCAKHADCPAIGYCSTDGGCYAKVSCPQFNDAVDSQCPTLGFVCTAATCPNGAYCSTDGSCYALASCANFQDSVTGSCPGAAGAKCTASTCPTAGYCSTDGSCYPKAECAQYQDSVTGSCQTVTVGGTCVGKCGSAVAHAAGCFCDQACRLNQDCCDNIGICGFGG